jgi:mandelate racemase
MPTIHSFRIRPVIVPMPEPHATASGTVSASPLVLLDITDSDGVTGHSITFTYTPAALKPSAELMQNVLSLIQGAELAPAAIYQKLHARFRLLGTQGLIGMVIAGIDMALWDNHARRAQLPLYRLLGAEPKRIPAYGAVGYDGEAGSAHVAQRWAEKGFRGIKAKIGYETVARDIAVIRAMRDAIGPDVAIMVDYNQSLLAIDAHTRIRTICNELGPDELTWIEEPLHSHDFAGHAQVTASTQIAIQAGENWWGPQDFMQAAHHHSTDLWMPDVMKVGGVTGWMAVANIANAQGMKVSNHLWPELSTHLMAATPTAHWLEYCDWWHPITAHPQPVEDGYAVPSERAGSGIEWNEEQISKLS